MAKQVFDDAELSAIKLAAEDVASRLGLERDDDKLAVCRAVFDIAAQTEETDPELLAEAALRRLRRVQ